MNMFPCSPRSIFSCQLAQTREWREAFKLMDEDRDGTVSVHALGYVLRALGRSLTQAELTDLVNQVRLWFCCLVFGFWFKITASNIFLDSLSLQV